MSFKKRLVMTILLLFSSAFALGTVSFVRAQGPPLVVSAWLENPVEIDGRMSSSYEWSEAIPVDVTIGLHFSEEPPFYKMRIWAKNDYTFLYLLYRIEYPHEERDDFDFGKINYYWPYHDEGLGRWPFSDCAAVSIGAGTGDGYGWDEERWYMDPEARLQIAEPPEYEPDVTPGEGGISWSLEMIALLVSIGGGAAGLLGWVLNARRTRKRKRVMFKEFLGEIDDTYTRFKMNARQCEGELLRIKEQIMQEFKAELIDPEAYSTLDKRLDDYLSEIREEISKRGEEDFEEDSRSRPSER